MNGFELQRLGILMEPQPGDPHEAEGVLNPAVARGPDGELYIFPRLVARGNYSRIGIARVRFNEAGDPEGVERLGIALEPETDYERGIDGRGGCEDPRVTFVEPLQRYLMTYTARSPRGPRIAAACSTDLFHWKRLGLVPFAPFEGLDLSNVDDKDACPFPAAVPNPSGQPELAMLHRPLFPGTAPEEKARHAVSHEVNLDRESIWISYRPISLEAFQPSLVDQFSHHRLATPVSPWECLKIGCGTSPILTRHGWLVVYHGVSEIGQPSNGAHRLCYAAGVMVLSNEQPQVIRYRSAEPVLSPTLPQERDGGVANVVFPTGIDRRDDIGSPDRFDIYYGMADYRIGVARLDLPDLLPQGEAVDPPAGCGH
jgi:beta-1,2-mannobiose phosphorylase / 1,2-beta-oligomannan phosphorylase